MKQARLKTVNPHSPATTSIATPTGNQRREKPPGHAPIPYRTDATAMGMHTHQNRPAPSGNGA
ncbi:protein of unknown function [Ralstonia solanacearum CMR15]|nr:protein of unknown function [Ralstonia solanacearum CMR15]